MESATVPKHTIRRLLQGAPLDRPLLLPVVFAPGARTQRMSLANFLSNPTKIAAAARQIAAYLRLDAITCYADPFLEAEALGATLQWSSESDAPRPARPTNLRTAEAAANAGRIPIACEVIRRLAITSARDHLLMACLSGPCTVSGVLEHESLEPAADLLTKISAKFAEAGANVVFIREKMLPLTNEQCDEWAALLQPAINIIRFYEALPVLVLPAPSEPVFNRRWDCVVCAPAQNQAAYTSSPLSQLGVALESDLVDLQPEGVEDLIHISRSRVEELHPVLITTTGDFPASADLTRISELLQRIRHIGDRYEAV